MFDVIVSLEAVSSTLRIVCAAMKKSGRFATTNLLLIPATGRDWASERPTASLYFAIDGDLKNPVAGSPSFGAELTMRWTGTEWLLEHDIGWIRSEGWDPVVSTETAFATFDALLAELEEDAKRFSVEVLAFLSEHLGRHF